MRKKNQSDLKFCMTRYTKKFSKSYPKAFYLGFDDLLQILTKRIKIPQSSQVLKSEIRKIM